ncbi:hypothetical protein [Microbacterium sp. bgisy203]|uniref:hypothetical protein n=1 Tax=Microbacterium sp. bgisy203 TaxID=3413799 RepID=UPI003D762602
MTDKRITSAVTTRRNFLSLAAVVAPASILTFCSPTPTRGAPPPTTEPRTPAPVSTGTAASTTRARVASYGPNGTHWPAHTRWIGDRSVRTVDVACDWTQIQRAIAAVNAAQADSGVHIRIKPGTLSGRGSSSGSPAVLEKVGPTNATRNILVSPRDGWGTVTIDGPARLRDVTGVTFARIDGDDILLTNCSRTAWAQSKMAKGLRMAASYESEVRECGAYEIVMSDAKADISDPLGYAAGRGSTIIDCIWEGCYSAPVFRPDGATDHVDTLQMYGTGWYRGLTIRDTTFFGSLNCALQIGGARDDDPNTGTPFLTIDHSIITSQATAIRARYPVPDGAQTPTMDQAINGVGEPGQLFATDSYLFGSLYRSEWGQVTNTRVSSSGALERNTTTGDGWIYDPAMSRWAAAEFDRLTPTPTDAYLAAIWK